ncbi:hypothetical protein RHA1_ro10438 (plasmid) [Rhodococcus jostii RHA1]|uniref:Uncharacterized protein n=1 Tax=Rhodococcus jostii (strain RHA1) TaxID=101510 RepID=Q0RVQ9_RHOJR|nr:hypothetical protein RHA1_ro10438 [Rhodococcus jostii RHA1]
MAFANPHPESIDTTFVPRRLAARSARERTPQHQPTNNQATLERSKVERSFERIRYHIRGQEHLKYPLTMRQIQIHRISNSPYDVVVGACRSPVGR